MTLAVVLFCASAAMAKDIRTAVFKVAQMKCENCVRKINNNIRFEKGLKDFHTDLKTKTVENSISTMAKSHAPTTRNPVLCISGTGCVLVIILLIRFIF